MKTKSYEILVYNVECDFMFSLEIRQGETELLPNIYLHKENDFWVKILDIKHLNDFKAAVSGLVSFPVMIIGEV